jgi:thiol-disulfide isomerase/thioredoxin
MKIVGMDRIAAPVCWLAFAASPGLVFAQGSPTMESINAEYERELIKLERHRLEGLGKLAASQPKEQAAAAYEAVFRLAITKNLYADAAPYAQKVLQSEAPSASVSWLAHLVLIVADADRGAYEESLKGLGSAIQLKGKAATRPAGLSVSTQASILDAYYQRLVHADQIEVARKAMKMVLDGAEAAPIRDLAGRRLKQLDMVGKVAPPIAGVDLDGKPFKLADARGDVVLVVFWATWCLPNAQEMPWLDYLDDLYKSKGLRVVGINLDSAQEGQEAKSVLPNIRRYLLDYNVTWPTLLNGQGEHDYASAFGVTEIPASVLVGRDGKISHVDLVGKRLQTAIEEAIARKP